MLFLLFSVLPTIVDKFSFKHRRLVILDEEARKRAIQNLKKVSSFFLIAQLHHAHTRTWASACQCQRTHTHTYVSHRRALCLCSRISPRCAGLVTTQGPWTACKARCGLYIYIRICSYTSECTHHICIYICIHVCIYVYIEIYVCIFIYD